MPITLLDAIVLSTMLISGLLAMVRGFMREVLSIAAWVAAALTTLVSYGKLVPPVQNYLGGNEIVAKVAVILGVFLATLIVVTIVTSKISDMVLDSRIGALDRTLGFLFGLARGLLILAVAFLFFKFLVQEKQQPDWVREAKSKQVLETTGDWLLAALPEDFLDTIQKRLKRDKDEQAELSPPSNATVVNDTGGYPKSQRDGLTKFIENKSITAGR